MDYTWRLVACPEISSCKGACLWLLERFDSSRGSVRHENRGHANASQQRSERAHALAGISTTINTSSTVSLQYPSPD